MCGRCGRRLAVQYDDAIAHYYWANQVMTEGRTARCLRVAAEPIDRAVIAAVLETGALDRVLVAADSLQARREAASGWWRRQVGVARQEEARTGRRYLSLVAGDRDLARLVETDWLTRLEAVATAESALTRRYAVDSADSRTIDRAALAALGASIAHVWSAPETSDRHRKELLRTLLEDVRVGLQGGDGRVRVVLRWRGGVTSELHLQPPRASLGVVKADGTIHGRPAPITVITTTP